jgi:hypothetical protein
MRMPRLRFTVRRMMVAVAIAAIPLAAITRGRHLAAVERRHRTEAASCIERFESLNLAMPLKPGATCGGDVKDKDDDEIERDLELTFGRGSAMYRTFRLWRHHRDLAERYQAARRRPWLPVEPDPPLPK